MAETKQIALGTIFKLDATQGGTFVAVPLMQNLTPPVRTRAEIESNALGDTLEVPQLGMESKSQMTFAHFWHPGQTEHEKWDTLFDSKDEADVQIVTPHGTPVTDEFTVQVVALTPQTLETNGMFRREITLNRTSDITRT